MNFGACYVIAIDVGVTGYACKMNINDFSVEFFPLPCIQYQRRIKTKTGEPRLLKCRRIDAKATVKLIRELAQPYVAFFCVEHQAPFAAKENSASVSKLLFAYGVICGAVLMTPIDIETPKPAVWKRALALIGKRKEQKLTQYAKKKKSYELAIHLFPQLKGELTPMTSNFDKSESLLLAYYGIQCLAPGMRLVEA